MVRLNRSVQLRRLRCQPGLVTRRKSNTTACRDEFTAINTRTNNDRDGHGEHLGDHRENDPIRPFEELPQLQRPGKGTS